MGNLLDQTVASALGATNHLYAVIDGTDRRMTPEDVRQAYPDVTALLAATSVWAEDDVICTLEEGYGYKVAASAATDHHATTAGGVKLYVLPRTDGVVPAGALGLDATGATDESAKVQKLIGYADIIGFPVGTFRVELAINSPVTLIGAGIGLTTLTSDDDTYGLTLNVTADLTLRDITIKTHLTSPYARTLYHGGANDVQAWRVLFDGANHSPAVGVSSIGLYEHCEFRSHAQATSFGALCWSAGVTFRRCQFTGERTVDASDSIFHYCDFGALDETLTCVHMPFGATSNTNSPTGFTGMAEFHDCRFRALDDGVTCGNDAHPMFYRCNAIVGSGSALYARSLSTLYAEDCDIRSNTGHGLFLSAADPYGVGAGGQHEALRCRIEGGNRAVTLPDTSDAYPTSVGNLLFTDCNIIGGDASISPTASTFYAFGTEKYDKYSDTLIFDNNETLQLVFKDRKMVINTFGTDAAKTGCHISHLDARTGDPLPQGMEIYVVYAGSGGRVVTFANGVTDDSGEMYFAGGASTLQVDVNQVAHFVLTGIKWRQV